LPTFAGNSTHTNTFEVCNYLTGVRNTGVVLGVVALLPIVLSCTLALLLVLIAVAFLFGYTFFVCVLLYTNDNESTESGDAVDLLVFAKGLLSKPGGGVSPFDDSTMLGMAKTEWSKGTSTSNMSNMEFETVARTFADTLMGVPPPEPKVPPPNADQFRSTYTGLRHSMAQQVDPFVYASAQLGARTHTAK
jgi:hypothetical protein